MQPTTTSPAARDPRDDEARLRAVLDALPTPVNLVEHGTRRVLFSNRAFLELVGLRAEDVAGVTQPYPWWADGQTPREIAEGHEYERVFRRPDGRPVPVRISIRDLRDDDGRVTSHLGVVTDLTERQRLEQQLAQSGKLAAIGELAAGVAHEINNPLFAILGLVEFVLADVEPGSKSHERLELVHRTALEIKDIVRALLDFARESSDERRVVALDEVIHETVELVRRTSANRGVEIEAAAGDDALLVEGSPNQLKQIFLNLLANARQAMPDGGTISIRVEAEGDAVVATVADTGPGIPPETLPHVFEPFFTTRRAAGGTGLGLSVSLGIAEAHGGSLTVASPGGAVFTLRLPRWTAA